MKSASHPLYDDAERFVNWLKGRIIASACGRDESSLLVEPQGKFWLGRLASEEHVAATLGERNERLEPCALGIRILPLHPPPWKLSVEVNAVAWLKHGKVWEKTEPIHCVIPILVTATENEQPFGRSILTEALACACDVDGLSAEIRCEVTAHSSGGHEITVLLVNTSPKEHAELRDTRLYQCDVALSGVATRPFVLESLPDSFRYDRRVEAYGVNGGVRVIEGHRLESDDTNPVSRKRPLFWGGHGDCPNLTFGGLAAEPIEPSHQLGQALRDWGGRAWCDDELERRRANESWSSEMFQEAVRAREDFEDEAARIEAGVELLEHNPDLHRAFRLMNTAMRVSAAGKYDGWRPFQLGFLLANLQSIVDPAQESRIVDIVWFSTGGGKTETYLGLLITAAMYDRLRGKLTGITAWSRFPLRMLSLQQLQRFADALAAAEIVRRSEGITGDPFSVGFFVGNASTPNAINPEPRDGEQYNVDDEGMPAALRMLQRCPFCRSKDISMAFNRRVWRLEHRCTNGECSWVEEALPFYVVDEEIYRFLPTVVVGTLDKAASISMQASMRGLFAPPAGVCPKRGHGFTYAKRSKRPQGCLVPGCTEQPISLPIERNLFAPTFRLQDELHLLKDSLGAVDSHYESLFDSLQSEISGNTAKILASSATLTGYARQVDVLYSRTARVFPQQPPTVGGGFWTTDSTQLMRLFVALAPRGLTLEYAVDRLLSVLQTEVRRLVSEPLVVCNEAAIDECNVEELLSLYGTDVVYGNTLRDLDAVMRSAETQLSVEGNVNVDTLTGRTHFEDITRIIQRLEDPEAAFDERLHVVTASSMMSHGIDIDRLNVMVMIGLPLTTAEFIQATARVGRKWPGLVLVLHKIGRERDAGVFRSFDKFVEQGDRFVEAVPITRRSRRVLERTIAGLELARILAVHEPRAQRSLALISAFRTFVRDNPGTLDDDREAMLESLGFMSDLDTNLIKDVERWFSAFERNLQDPLPGQKFTNEASPTGPPMRSLRDVEEAVPVYLNRL